MDAVSLGGGDPLPSSSGEVDQHRSNKHEVVRGRFCEVSGGDNRLTAQIREYGVAVHELSGGIDLQSSEPFDSLKVAVKRGEIDWLHIIPEYSWMVHERVVTRLIKLCRVAHRRGIWWSIENPTTSELWCSNTVKKTVRRRRRALCSHGVVSGLHQCGVVG